MKHTPGPWQQTGTIIWSQGEGIICELSEIRPPGCIVKHYQVGLGSKDWGEAMANGRLIIAAPEFLKGLCKAINFLDALPRYPSPFLNVAQSLRDELQELIDQVSVEK